MYPTKSAIDYSIEINKLFDNTKESDILDLQTNFQLSPFNYSTVNRSSSSADSLSPESFPDISHRVYTAPSSVFGQQDFTKSELESPHVKNRHRPIVGRRLMTSDPAPILKDENLNSHKWNVDVSVWKPNEVLSKPLDANIFIESDNKYNTFYELFPESSHKELKSSTRMSTISCDSSNTYPREMNSQSLSDMSPNMVLLEPLVPNQYHLLSPVMSGPSSSHIGDTQKVCTFCRKNGETPLVYTTHTVKQKVGKKHIVTCPILRSHVCSTCGVSGDQAHTITYCPVLRNNNNGQPLLSTTVTLKNTRVKSNGRRRY